jgi:hypothetical protein
MSNRNISPEIERLNRDISDFSQTLNNASLVHLAKNTKGSLQRVIAKQAAGRGIALNGEWVGFPQAEKMWKAVVK